MNKRYQLLEDLHSMTRDSRTVFENLLSSDLDVLLDIQIIVEHTHQRQRQGHITVIDSFGLIFSIFWAAGYEIQCSGKTSL